MSIARFWEVDPIGDGRFAAELHEGWYQGRGVYGGLVAAILASSMRRGLAETDRPMRTVHVSFTSPATAGPVELHVERLRVGRSVAVLSSRMVRDGKVLAAAQATFAHTRTVGFGFDEPMAPPLPPHETVPDGPAPLYIPDFCDYFEFRQTEGPASFSGGMRAHLAGWCRPKEPTPLSAELVLALLDAWAPAALCRRSSWAPAASIDLSADLPASYPAVPDDAFAMYMADSTFAKEGYADERSKLWSADGKWLGSVRQLIALFDPPKG